MQLSEQHGIFATTDRLTEIAGVHRTTAERWKRAQRIPRSVQLLLRLMLEGELELLHPAWTGWRLDVRSGEIYTPDGWPCRPSDILGIRYRVSQIHALELELARLRHPKPAGFIERLLKRA